MPLSHWKCALLAAAIALSLVGCRSNTPASVAADSGTATASAPSQAPAVPAAPSGPALSYLKPVGSQECAWVRHPLPTGEPVVVATFEADCLVSLLSWSPDGREGLVVALGLGGDELPRLWRVDFAARSSKRLDMAGVPGWTAVPGIGKPVLEAAGFDRQGRLVVLMADLEPPGDLASQHEGTPGVTMAYRLEGTEWKRFEGDAAKALYVPASLQYEEMPGHPSSESTLRLLAEALSGLRVGDKWMTLSTPGGPLHYRAWRDEDNTFYPSAPLRWEREGKLEELEGVTAQPGGRVELVLQGELLLVEVGGESDSAHVLDTRTRKSLASVKDMRAVNFWPQPLKP